MGKNISRRTDTEAAQTEYENLNKRLSAVLFEIAVSKGNDNVFISMTNAGECLIEACNKPTPENIKKVMGKYNWKITDTQAKELSDIINATIAMPVNIFEAKPQRVVGFDEIVSVILPDNVREQTTRQLDELGIPYRKYEAGNEDVTEPHYLPL